MINNCKLKYKNFLEKNNLKDENNIFELFDKFELDEILKKLETFNKNITIDYVTEIICEELLITSSYKIERSGMKLGLHRMKKILGLFNNPEKSLNIIHVAGTNGKGSTCSYLKDIFKIKYRVGLYTSPGMLSFNDRIRINDKFIPYKRAFELFKLVEKTWSDNNPHSTDNLSFFEIITTVAILYFKEQGTDFVIMEVGLGGRFDGTNIFEKKLLSVITKISLDHTNILGNTLEEIAFEKAGIIQKNDNVIIYPSSNSIEMVIKNICKEKNATLTILNTKDIQIKSIHAHGNEFNYKNKTYSTKMIGEHQIYNCSLALLVLENLQQRKIIDIDFNTISRAVATSNWAGRLEWIRENILLDGAHNNDGVNSLVNYLKMVKFPKLKILLGILEDKDYSSMIEIIKTIPAEFFITKVPIAIKESNLNSLVNAFDTTFITKFEDYEQALANLVPNLKNDEILLITGSLYLISAVRSEIIDHY